MQYPLHEQFVEKILHQINEQRADFCREGVTFAYIYLVYSGAKPAIMSSEYGE